MLLPDAVGESRRIEEPFAVWTLRLREQIGNSAGIRSALRACVAVALAFLVTSIPIFCPANLPWWHIGRC